MYRGSESAATAQWLLRNKRPCIIICYGTYLDPLIKPSQAVVVAPIGKNILKRNDLVFCNAYGRYRIRKILYIEKGYFHVGTADGYGKSAISRKSIYGLVIRKLKRNCKEEFE